MKLPCSPSRRRRTRAGLLSGPGSRARVVSLSIGAAALAGAQVLGIASLAGASTTPAGRLGGSAVAALSPRGVSLLAATGTVGPNPGPAVAWGSNAEGEIGNGTTSGSVAAPVSVTLPGGYTLSQVSGGGYHSLGVSPGGSVFAWGSNASGQLGDGSTTSSDVPVSLAGGPVTKVAAGTYFSLALTASGQVYAWGDNSSGELGNGSNSGSAVPVATTLPAKTVVREVATTQSTSFVLTSTGQVYAWGDNLYGDLGDGTFGSQSNRPVLVKLPAGTRAVAIAGEGYSGLAVASTGKVYAWGFNGDGELGNGTFVNSDVPVPVRLPAGVTIRAIAGERNGGLALTSTGKVYAWGYNGYGNLGNGTTVDSSVPVAVHLSAGASVQAISGQNYGGMALTSKGTVLAWGYNFDGELGNGTLVSSDVPVPVAIPASTRVASIAGVGYGGLALTSAGAVLSWGTILGNGSSGASSDVPVAVRLPSGTRSIAVAGDDISGLSVTSTGQLLGWGYNGDGELGNGTTAYAAAPTAVLLPPGVTVTSVSQGFGDSVLAVVSVPPVVSALSPKVGSAGGGTRVLISGKGLTGVTAVHFGTRSATKVSVVSPTSLVATSPAGPGTVNVSVTGSGGTSLDVAADRFSYRRGAVERG